jgi:asparagine synthase (glutamine-hydrolysing)
LHGVQLRHPLRDRRLVEFTLALPETLFLQQGVRRWFARQVLKDRLPAEILDEMRPGTQSPEWYQRMTAHRAELMAQSERLFGSALAARVIDLPRLRRLINAWAHDATPASRPSFAQAIAVDRALHVGRFIRWVEGANR